MPLIPSWVESANDAQSPFPLNNLPYGVFSVQGGPRRLGVAIGDRILDVAAVADALPVALAVLTDPRGWNGLMEAGPGVWADVRQALTDLLAAGARPRPQALIRMHEASLHLPFTLSEYTDFYAGQHHARNVGTMFRGADTALPPNWLHMPIGYNGRASSVVVSGTEVRRPWGQIKGPDEAFPHWAPCRKFDIELEIGAIVGTPSTGPLGVDRADAHIFGHVLLNDWSARDIQAWEYQPLGPFQSKATATTISPWIVTSSALAPFRVDTPAREVPLLPHLADIGPMGHDIALRVTLAPKGGAAQVISRTNADQLYYSAAQQLAHHASSGCPMRVGDLLGSGTISGPAPDQRGSLLEMSWNGTQPLTLAGGATRSFIEDGDTLGLEGEAIGDGYRIGFGPCVGTVLPALADPFGAGTPGPR